jgi:predicted small metal-binding protein
MEVIRMTRKVFDCRNLPGECTLAISGEEEEVVRAQLLHAIEAHGVEDTPEMRKWIRGNLKDATD